MEKSANKPYSNTVPTSVANEITALTDDPNAGSQLFRLIYSYYIGREGANLSLKVSFDAQAYKAIAPKVPLYDDRG